MEEQLTLIEQSKPWRLDDRTVEIGRQGLARARAALQSAVRQRPESEAEAA